MEAEYGAPGSPSALARNPNRSRTRLNPAVSGMRIFGGHWRRRGCRVGQKPSEPRETAMVATLGERSGEVERMNRLPGLRLEPARASGSANCTGEV